MRMGPVRLLAKVTAVGRSSFMCIKACKISSQWGLGRLE